MLAPLLILGVLLAPAPAAPVAILEDLPDVVQPWMFAERTPDDLFTRPTPVTVDRLSRRSAGEVEITFSRADGARIKLVTVLPSATPLPFGVGESVSILVGERPVPGDRVVNTLVVRDPSGALLLAFGDASTKVAPFRVAPGKIVGREDKGSHVAEDRALVVSHPRARSRVVTTPWTWQVWPIGLDQYALWSDVRTSQVPKAGPPLPPDFVAGFTSFVIVKVRFPIGAFEVDDQARFDWARTPDLPPGFFDVEVGPIRAIRGGHSISFVPLRDSGRGAPIVASINLTRGVPFPFRTGDRVRVELGHEGDGPRKRGTIVVVDREGELLLALGQRDTRLPEFKLETGPDQELVLSRGTRKVTLPAVGGVTWVVDDHRYAAWGTAAGPDVAIVRLR